MDVLKTTLTPRRAALPLWGLRQRPALAGRRHTPAVRRAWIQRDSRTSYRGKEWRTPIFLWEGGLVCYHSVFCV
jgi:hypothetical protein